MRTKKSRTEEDPPDRMVLVKSGFMMNCLMVGGNVSTTLVSVFAVLWCVCVLLANSSQGDKNKYAL